MRLVPGPVPGYAEAPLFATSWAGKVATDTLRYGEGELAYRHSAKTRARRDARGHSSLPKTDRGTAGFLHDSVIVTQLVSFIRLSGQGPSI